MYIKLIASILCSHYHHKRAKPKSIRPKCLTYTQKNFNISLLYLFSFSRRKIFIEFKTIKVTLRLANKKTANIEPIRPKSFPNPLQTVNKEAFMPSLESRLVLLYSCWIWCHRPRLMEGKLSTRSFENGARCNGHDVIKCPHNLSEGGMWPSKAGWVMVMIKWHVLTVKYFLVDATVF